MGDETPRSLEKTQALERQVADLRSEIQRIRSGVRGVRPVLFVVLLITALAGTFVYKSWQESRQDPETIDVVSPVDSSSANIEKGLAALKGDYESTIDRLETQMASLREQLASLPKETANSGVSGEQIQILKDQASKALRTANAIGKSIDELKRSVHDSSLRFRDVDKRLDAHGESLEGAVAKTAEASKLAEAAAKDANLSATAIMDLLRRLDETQKRVDELESKLKKVGERPFRSTRGGLTVW